MSIKGINPEIAANITGQYLLKQSAQLLTGLDDLLAPDTLLCIYQHARTHQQGLTIPLQSVKLLNLLTSAPLHMYEII